ncbi:acyl-CoA dehydrogenase family protein [Chitinophaga japonensis]|uniref:Alkylation response protein AidB-like acyl-CoA dehydrogenase n=1 Tax=Chitinophaga japonensis TaxID=104662 RepID=A0A562T0A7_CHIJA|nr:acyl-CoA dehydrogenase family protein [Chitinophaga japonensis]TWI86694.1 alkylation response protein AidB-like acyl-CoA dehydrogenase [Chitinophaga japonensis]
MNYPSLTTTGFLEQLETLLRTFDCHRYPAGHMPRYDWKKLVEAGVVLPIIPKHLGGRGSHEEVCHIIRKAAYYNVSLAIYINITGLLFIRNVMNHGSPQIRQEFLDDLYEHAALGGFAVTDPVSGSDPTLMQAFYEKVEGGYRVTGRKHWQAFSKTADWWLIMAREAGDRAGEFNGFIHRRANGGFDTLQLYSPAGTRLIDYGMNKMNVFIPDHARLAVDHMSFTMLLELIGAAWSQWAAIACGFLERIYAEALAYVQSRPTAGGTVMDIGYVQYRLGVMAAASQVCQALYLYVLHQTDCVQSEIRDIFVVRAVKTLASDLMLDAALHYQQLCGGEGYRYHVSSNIAAQAMQDARGFSILGGSNDMIYPLITRHFLDACGEQGHLTFFSMLGSFPHTAPSARYIAAYAPALEKMPEGHAEMVLYGKVLARLFGITAITLYSAEMELTEANTRSAIACCVAGIAGIIAELAATAVMVEVSGKK